MRFYPSKSPAEDVETYIFFNREYSDFEVDTLDHIVAKNLVKLKEFVVFEIYREEKDKRNIGVRGSLPLGYLSILKEKRDNNHISKIFS